MHIFWCKKALSLISYNVHYVKYSKVEIEGYGHAQRVIVMTSKAVSMYGITDIISVKRCYFLHADRPPQDEPSAAVCHGKVQPPANNTYPIHITQMMPTIFFNCIIP